jgi:hypothetical protein
MFALFWYLRFELDLSGSTLRIPESDRESKILKPEPESWRLRVESNLTSRDFLRGLAKTHGIQLSNKNSGKYSV